MKALLQFRIYPTRKRQPWFRVLIWKTKSEMHAALRADSHDPEGCEAICCGYERVVTLIRHRWRRVAWLGDLHFYLGSLLAGVISHECAHAMFRYADWAKIDYRRGMKRHEERLASAAGNLYRLIVCRIYSPSFRKRTGWKP